MNDTVLLESEQFALSLNFQVFESDIEYPSIRSSLQSI